MANEEQLSILKQGVEVWNKWRDKNRNFSIDLHMANLGGVDLSNANLAGADLVAANFSKANLSGSNLSRANLMDAVLIEASLQRAALNKSDLGHSNLSEADLNGASLWEAKLLNTDLSGANLSATKLIGADLSDVDLTGSNFLKAEVGGTIFRNLDLSVAVALEDVFHKGPSSISTDTFVYSEGKIPAIFLQGCGLSDWEIELVKLYDYEIGNEERNRILDRLHDLTAEQTVQISPLFISYSHADTEFVNKIGDCLTEKGIRYWRDIHDMKAGRIEKQIDRAISQNRTVLLVLSENSLKSDWVEHEVRTARGLEKDMGRDVLCPVALDDSWKSSHWPKRVMEQIKEYNILDFSAWKDDVKFEDMFRKLIDGLQLFYKR